MNIKEEVLAILFMRFKVQLPQAVPMVENWLIDNQQESWDSLKNLLKQNQLMVVDGVLQKSSQQKFKILCIDDSPIILREINRFLEEYNYSVFLLNNPLNALREMIRIVPDLILMDVNMPGIDGYKICRLIRNHSVLKTKPIVMMTSNTGIIDRAKARMAGANEYLTKPFSRSEFLTVVSHYSLANKTRSESVNS